MDKKSKATTKKSRSRIKKAQTAIKSKNQKTTDIVKPVKKTAKTTDVINKTSKRKATRRKTTDIVKTSTNQKPIRKKTSDKTTTAKPKSTKIAPIITEISTVPESTISTNPNPSSELLDSIESVTLYDETNQEQNEPIQQTKQTDITPQKNPTIELEMPTKPEETTKRTSKSTSPKLKGFKKFYSGLAKTLAIASIIGLIALLVNIFRFNILPIKYLTMVIAGIALLAILILFFAFFKKKPMLFRTLSLIFSTICIVVSLFVFFKINDTINFFSNFGSNKTISTYNVLVVNDSPLTEESDISGYNILTFRDLMLDSSIVESAIQTEFSATTTFTDSLLSLFAYGKEDGSHLISLNAGTYESVLADNNSYKDDFRIIKTFDIVTDVKESAEIDVAKTPFAIFLSGIDTRSGTLPSRSLSDVNIVAVINPEQHKILLVAIPRDYYVHLHGTGENSLNDKLTHAGSIGGVELSKATIEDLLDLKIDYYARVNFNFVQNLVDKIGGITINSDVDYSFTCWTNQSCTFKPGPNQVGGACALAFARERKAYSSGDRHRGENQEQVIGLILKKITSSTTLLSSYSDILDALNGTFETSFNMEDVTRFFRNQLEDMQSWTVENQNLDGTTGGAPTYSYPAQNLSIMYPDPESIDKAKIKIKEYLGLEVPEPTSSETTDSSTVEE